MRDDISPSASMDSTERVDTVTTLPTTGSERARQARTALERAKRIVVITKFRFMGDTIVAVPLLSQLRDRFPCARITLLTSDTAAAALAGCPFVDRIQSLDIKSAGRVGHTRELTATLREGRYDVAVVLNRSAHCAVVTALSGIPCRIGFAGELRSRVLTLPVPYRFDRNEIDCLLDTLRFVGIQARAALPQIWITDEERQAARTILEAEGWNGSARLIGVQPGSNDAHIREWGTERFAKVADRLVRQTGGTVVVHGGPTEIEAARRMAEAMESAPINLTGRLPIRQALAAIGLSSLWIGNDTGLLHAAVAQNVPSVGIFGPTKIVRWGYDTPTHRSIASFPERESRDDQTLRRCLDAITVDEVAVTALEVLNANTTMSDGVPSQSLFYSRS